MYEKLLTGLVYIGLTASLIYVVTWTIGAVKARYFKVTTLTPWEIVDFGALPFAASLILVVNAVNIWVYGVVTPATTALKFQRFTTLVLIVAIVMLRLFRWLYRWFRTPKEERPLGAALTDRPKQDAS